MTMTATTSTHVLDHLIPQTIAYFESVTPDRLQGLSSRAIVDTILANPLVAAGLKAADAAAPHLNMSSSYRQSLVDRVGSYLRRKDARGVRLYVNIVLPGEEPRYIPFRVLRLAELVAYQDTKEQQKKRNEEELRKIRIFRQKLEQYPANTTVDDIYDQAVAEF